MTPQRIGVLISGSGTNLQAMIDTLPSNAEISVVISNKSDAFGLKRAQNAGIPTEFISHRTFSTREEYDKQLVETLRSYQVEWIVLAGFMRIVTPVFLNAYRNRVINIHPALLPSFKGVRAQRQAHEYGVRITGATVHIVTPEMDAGPIINQGAVSIPNGATEDEVKARILSMEHRLLPQVIHWIAEERLHVDDENVRVDLRDNESLALFE